VGDLTTHLARLRVSLGFASAILVVWLARPTAATLVAGSLVAACGEALRIWAAGHLNKSREVTSSGPYQWFAHPLYVGSSIMGAGLAIASGSVAVAIVIALYLGTTITAAIRSEEAFLRQKFGAQYESYRRGVASRDRESATRRFSVAQALANREHRAVAGVVLAILLLGLKAAYNGAFWRTAGTP
jgi:protein-S-isoprenylcysteine O-methyltransferase Ste14